MALTSLLSGVFGTRHDRERKRVQPIVDEINEHYARLQTISEEELKAQTEKFRARIREVTGELETRIAELKERKRATSDPAARDVLDNELSGVDGRGGVEAELRQATAEVLDEILPEAFATVREAARRLLGTKVTVTGQEMDWNMVPYDEQLMGGIQLHEGRIAEMATGEGKTLVAHWAGNDEWSTRFVDEYRIDFVDDGVDVAALHPVLQRLHHVVAQIVEAELVVGAVGDVALVACATRHRARLGVVNAADGEPEVLVDVPHPLRVATGEI